MEPNRLEIDAELWERIRTEASRQGVSISEFIMQAFQAEARRLRDPLANVEDDADAAPSIAPDSKAVADRALRRALGETGPFH